jgi:hypothetical protein
MRRFVYDRRIGGFVFLPLNVGTTFGDFVDQVHGLSLTEVTERRGKAGVQCYSVAETIVHWLPYL